MNDPTEESYFNDVIKIVLADSDDCNKIYSELYDESYQNSVLNPTGRFIASFSKNEDSLSMWNYYAKGNGYNIGLDIDSIIKANKSEGIFIRKVELIYQKSVQIQRIKDFILEFGEDYEKYIELGEKKMAAQAAQNEQDYYYYDGEQLQIPAKFNDEIFEMVICFKHQAYEREEEVRLIISLDILETTKTSYKVSENGVFVEYFPLSINLKEQMKSVTIHPLNSDLHLQGITGFISSKIGHEKAKINLSKIPFRII